MLFESMLVILSSAFIYKLISEGIKSNDVLVALLYMKVWTNILAFTNFLQLHKNISGSRFMLTAKV